MPNPHYSPEVQVKISLVNFTVTQSGLEEQLLGATVCISVRQLIFSLSTSESVVEFRHGNRNAQVFQRRYAKLGNAAGNDTLVMAEIRV